jgi:hypothetical protein
MINTKPSILETVAQFFVAENWPAQQVKGRPVLEMSARTATMCWGCFAEAREETSELLFYSVAPFGTPADKLTDVAELLTRINYGLPYGNYEMDWHDGEIRFKTSIDVEGDELSAALLRQVVYRNVHQMGRFMPGIKALIEEDLSVEEVLKKIDWI